MANAFFSQHVNPIRLQALFNTLGIALFLWFVGSLWRTLRGAEGEPGRGSTLAVVGAGVGSGLVLHRPAERPCLPTAMLGAGLNWPLVLTATTR